MFFSNIKNKIKIYLKYVHGKQIEKSDSNKNTFYHMYIIYRYKIKFYVSKILYIW